MKKSINLWAFPQGPNMSLAACFELAARAGFDAVELNYDLEGYLSPATSDREIAAIGQLARSRAFRSAASVRSCSSPIR